MTAGGHKTRYLAGAALIAAAVIDMIRVMLFTEEAGKLIPQYKGCILCVIIFALLQWKKLQKLHPAVWFLVAAAAGVVFQF